MKVEIRKIRAFIIMISIIFIFINAIKLTRNNNIFNYELGSKIKKPIIVIENDDRIETKIKEKSFPIEYNFSIHNFEEDKINEIACEYNIELENSVSNFPVSYTLIDCDTGKKIDLIDGKSNLLKINKDKKVSKKFKLILKWRELNIELANELEIKLKINIMQEKKNEV